ncbi:MAG: hypothetical protein WDM86_09475 [Rhizomicrobium sp.]
MSARLLLVVLLALGAGGCSVNRVMALTSPDWIIAGLGLPQRGFATDSLFPDDGPPGRYPPDGTLRQPDGAQAPQFCVARGYVPGTANYDRCVVSVKQNLRRQGP